MPRFDKNNLDRWTYNSWTHEFMSKAKEKYSRYRMGKVTSLWDVMGEKVKLKSWLLALQVVIY